VADAESEGLCDDAADAESEGLCDDLRNKIFDLHIEY
jgi:hypothetical protein